MEVCALIVGKAISEIAKINVRIKAIVVIVDLFFVLFTLFRFIFSVRLQLPSAIFRIGPGL